MSDQELPVCTTAFRLNNGTEFPAVGLGTWQGQHGSNDTQVMEESIVFALQNGYRLIDTAQFYGVEEAVGRAIRASGIPRKDITVVTKFWGDWHHNPAEALRISLASLGLDYIDVFLMHWPWATTPAPERKVLRIDESPTFLETWKLMENLVGPQCRGIGVSNFTQKTLDALLADASVVPVVNQVELHAFNPNHKLVPYCQSKGIHVMSWSTLGGQSDGENLILSHDLFTNIAKAHNVSTGVVSLSWAVQRGISVIPKSSSHSRLASNIRLVTLTEDEMAAINNAYKTIKSQRNSNGDENLHRVIDGKRTFMGWSYVDFGWEDAQGNWLV